MTQNYLAKIRGKTKEEILSIEAYVNQIQRRYPFIKNVRHYLEVEPNTAPRMTRSDAWKKRPCVMQYRGFKDEFRAACNVQGYQLEEVLDIVFIIPMPKSWSKKEKQEKFLTKHLPKPDRDNLLKAVQDAFNANDSFVWDGRTTKLWGYFGSIIIYDGSI